MRAWPRAPKFIIHNDASETLPEPHTLQQMSPWSQPWKMCRVNTATPAPGPSAGSSCQHWGPRTPRLAALLLLLLPGEQEHRCRLREQVEKDSELKRGSCRQPGAHSAGGAGRAEGRGLPALAACCPQPSVSCRAPASGRRRVVGSGGGRAGSSSVDTTPSSTGASVPSTSSVGGGARANMGSSRSGSCLAGVTWTIISSEKSISTCGS
ncbi:uncharacterized protein LOC131396698 isoform X1 [Diceros bicornis minor]|nr:uncharacterized protein LOC131396698 isoform X1 [Diceros bicornis minor]